jgi:hypothetical protein
MQASATSIIDRDTASCGECGGSLAILGTPASGHRTEQRMTALCLDCGRTWLFVLRLVLMEDVPRRRPKKLREVSAKGARLDLGHEACRSRMR